MDRIHRIRHFWPALSSIVMVLLLTSTVLAQDPAPTPVTESTPDAAKECAELQKQVDDYAEETFKAKLTLSFKNNTSYWNGAGEELRFGIDRRRVAGSLQSIAFKLGVKRLKDWAMVPLEEKLAYQKTVSRALERERENAISANQAALETRLIEVETRSKAVRLRARDLGCADLPQVPAGVPVNAGP